MTTTRMEEKYWNDKPKKIATGEGVIISLTKKEFDDLVTQAHQAGIDEAVEVINNRRQQLKDELSHYVDGYYTEKEDTNKHADEFIDDTIKALQDKK